MLDIKGPAPGMGNGFNLYVMNSHENADKLISAFKKEYKAGMVPNDVIDYVLDKYNINEDFFTDADVKRINREMTNFCKYGV